MKIMVLAQEDAFFIPHNIAMLREAAEIVEIVKVDCKYSLDNSNMKKNFLKWFGPWQVGRMAAVFAWRKLLNRLDPWTGWRLLQGEGGLESVARRHSIAFRCISNVNAPEFVEHVCTLQPDLICSYSAPQVIKEPLLSMPRYGNINVHGSLLPDFRGTLPSFWALYKGAGFLGASVHYMSAKIDDGGIILQKAVPNQEIRSMFAAMQLTKKIGGELMVDAIRAIQDGRVELKENDSSKGAYYSWPTAEDAREFRKAGYRLI